MKQFSSFILDIFSFCSLIGIWPRYIEPRLLKKTYLNFHLSHLNPLLKGLKIIQFTDLHFHPRFSLSFLKKIQKNILEEKPDIILFTGDFLCYSRLEKQEILQEFLQKIKAPLGCFGVFGNHDYASYVSRNKLGDYAPKAPINPLAGIAQGLSILFFEKSSKKAEISEEAKKIKENTELNHLLSQTSFRILNNETSVLPCGLNIVGLGEYGLGRAQPELAFKGYDERFPGIILVHNPDATPSLAPYPGHLILSGHTHGEQIRLPFFKKLSKKLARLENAELTRGLYHLGLKQLYVNRGLGSHEPFRLFSPPELLIINLT